MVIAVRGVQDKVRAFIPEAGKRFWTFQVHMLVEVHGPGKCLFAKGAPLSHSVILSATLGLSLYSLLLLLERTLSM